MQPVDRTTSTAPLSQEVPRLTTLTPREREVAALVAEGLTNAEIARRLVLSPGTIANHIEHSLRALGVRGRVGLAVWAVKQELY
jgi:DNA-binding NarL/FixJ family response regulator